MSAPGTTFTAIKAWFHALSQANTEAAQNLYESVFKSAHNIGPDDVRTQSVDYAVNAAAAAVFAAANPTILKQYTNTALTQVSGSNGQAWYLSDGGNFMKGWVNPVDVLNGSGAPAYGYQALLYTEAGVLINPTAGTWLIDYNAGIIYFQKGSTPADMGWGTPQITAYVYIGKTLTNAFRVVKYPAAQPSLPQVYDILYRDANKALFFCAAGDTDWIVINTVD